MRFILIVFSVVLFSLRVEAQECPSIPKTSGEIRAGSNYMGNPDDQKFRAWMRNATADELDQALAESRTRACRSNIPGDDVYVLNWAFVYGQGMAGSRGGFIRVKPDVCDLIKRTLRCYQEQGWPLSRNPRASAATATKKEVSGKDILAAELTDQKRNSAKEDAFDQIDAEAERLGCDKVGSSKSTACDDLNIQRQNLINDERQMKGTSTDTATQRKLPNSIKPADSKASPSKTTSVDVDGGMSASQCVDASLSEPVYFRSGDKRECPAIKDGVCHNYKVTLTMTNNCKRTVSSEVEWGGKTGYITASGRNSGTTECQASSGTPGSPKTTCSPGTLIDPKFSN